MTTIVSHGYAVQIVSPTKAIVSGGLLAKPILVSTLLGKGDANPKTAKNIVKTFGLSLYPHQGIGFGNVCPHARNCVSSCLAKQGQGPMPSVTGARVAKTVLWYLARDWFLAKLRRELSAIVKRHHDIEIGVRLNMFSDIPWEHFGIPDAFPTITFYDYTKNPRRVGWIRANYYTTFSFDGLNTDHAVRLLSEGKNVAVVFYNPDGKCGKAAHRQKLPAEFLGHSVIDGGETDWRPGDSRGVVVGLRLLARTYQSRNAAIDSGFAQLVNELVAS